MVKFLFFALFFSISPIFNLDAAVCSRDDAKTAIDYMESLKAQHNANCQLAQCLTTPSSCLGRMRLYLENTFENKYIVHGEMSRCDYSSPGYGSTSYPNPVDLSCPGDHGPKDFVEKNPNPNIRCGSIIQTSNQVVGERIPVVGVNFDLVYFSNRVVGRRGDYMNRVQVTGPDSNPAVSAITVEVKDEVGAVIYNSVYGVSINQNYDYEWSVTDANTSPRWATIPRVFKTLETASDFTAPENPVTKNIGALRAKKLGLGGWFPSNWHFYDFSSGTLYTGDGSFRSVEAVTAGALFRITSIEGSEVYYFDSSGKIVETKHGLTGTTLFTFQYNSAGHLINITEPFSRITNFNRDVSGNFISITSPNLKVSLVTLDPNGYLNSITGPLGETYEMTYATAAAEGLLLTFDKPNGTGSTMTYDSYGNLLSDTHSSGFMSSLLKTAIGVTATSALGRETTNKYIAGAFTELETRPSGYVLESGTNPYYEYKGGPNYSESNNWIDNDRFPGLQSRILSRTSSDAFGSRATDFTNSYVLNTPGDPFSINTLTTLAVTNESRITTVYNGSTKTFLTTTRLGRTNTSVIDTYGRQISEKRGNLTAQVHTYTNELLTKTTQGTREVNFSYDPTTKLLSSITNPLSQVISFSYDDAERLLSKTLPDSRVINYTYDSNGNLTSITPPSRPVHELNFGISEKIESYNPPLLTGVPVVNTLYSYDLDKQLTKIERPDGEDIDFNYDITTGQLSTISGSFGTITNNYLNELPLSVTDQHGSIIDFVHTGFIPTKMTLIRLGTTPFYEFSRTPSTAFPGKIGSEVFKGLGASSVTRTINYTYDNDELLKKIGDLNIVHNVPNGLLTETTLGTIKDAYGYNTFGELTSYNVKYGTTIIYEYTLTRDSLGRISQKVETLNGVISVYDYIYDAAGRLTQVNKNGVSSSIYGYDNNSNRISGSIRGETTVAIYDNQDRLTNYNGTARTYNANGELLTSGTKSLIYDVFGNLKSHTSGSTTINYEIDPLQRRMGRLVGTTLSARYMYNPEGQVVGELNNLNRLVKTFVYGTKNHVPDYYVDSSNNKFRIITDNLGSVRLVVSSAGVVSQLMEHDEFGRVLQDTNPGLTPFGFAGGVYDSATGLVRFGARDYDPEIGRWLSKDPIRFKGGDTNLYGYVLQDPINWIDPTGTYLAPIANPKPIGSIGSIIGIVIGGGVGGIPGGVVGGAVGSVIGGVVSGVIDPGAGDLGTGSDRVPGSPTAPPLGQNPNKCSM